MKVIYTMSDSIAPEEFNRWFDEVRMESVVYFSTPVQLSKLRVEHMLGSIVVESIEIKGETIHILEDGNFDYFPEDFFDEAFNLACDIARLAKDKGES